MQAKSSTNNDAIDVGLRWPSVPGPRKLDLRKSVRVFGRPWTNKTERCLYSGTCSTYVCSSYRLTIKPRCCPRPFIPLSSPPGIVAVLPPQTRRCPLVQPQRLDASVRTACSISTSHLFITPLLKRPNPTLRCPQPRLRLRPICLPLLHPCNRVLGDLAHATNSKTTNLSCFDSRLRDERRQMRVRRVLGFTTTTSVSPPSTTILTNAALAFEAVAPKSLEVSLQLLPVIYRHPSSHGERVSYPF